MKQNKNYSLLPFLGLAFLRKEFLKSRPGVQDDHPAVSRSSINPALLPLRSIQHHEGTGVSLGIQGSMYSSSQVFLEMLVCISSRSQVLRGNFREHLILPELKHLLFYFLQAVGVKQQSVIYCW